MISTQINETQVVVAIIMLQSNSRVKEKAHRNMRLKFYAFLWPEDALLGAAFLGRAWEACVPL